MESKVLIPNHEFVPYSDRSFLVFGATSGIGFETVAVLKQAGAANIYMGTSNLDHFADALSNLQRRKKVDISSGIYPFSADVRDKSQIARAVKELKAKGLGVTDAIFSQAGGMEGFMQELNTKYLEDIVQFTFETPLDELDEATQQIVLKKLEAMRKDLEVWTQEAMPGATAVNYDGTFNAIDVLSEAFPEGFTGVVLNSMWGKLSGLPGIEIPLLYRPVDITKGMVRDRLQRDAEMLSEQKIYICELVATLVKETKVGKMFRDFFFNLMTKEQREGMKDSSVGIRDVVNAEKVIFESNPKKWGKYPKEVCLYGKNGQVVMSDTLEISPMYKIPYLF